MRLGLPVSVALHGAALGMLVWLANTVPPPLDVPPPKGFEIAINQPTAAVVPVQAVQPPPDTAPPVPPEPEKAVTATEVPIAREPEVPVVTARERRPPPKPLPKPKPPPRPVVRRPEPEPERQMANLPPALPSPAPASTQAPAAYAPPAPAAPNPDLAAHYRAMLSGWFESHKRYPNSARDAAEQGNAVIRFRVDASGRVLSFGLTKGTGYPDLDQSINAMMQSAMLPAFPPGLTLSYLDVSVTLRYSLAR
ncbi:MAG TPA: TonB family protein [Stellaceae bacterium]